MKALKLISQELYQYKEPPLYEGESVTQPDMTLSIQEIYNRSMRGMEVQGFQPIYYNHNHKELVGFENLSKLEKIEFSRRFKKYATSEVDRLKRAADEQKAELAKQKAATEQQ